MHFILDFLEGVELNNKAHQLDCGGHYREAIEIFKKAIELKTSTFGEDSMHVCISLSGLADSYLHNKQYKDAAVIANKMLRIALKIANREQIRIAREILADVNRCK